MDETYDVVVVGAGLAGLTAAATAADGSGCSVLVLDGQAAGRGGRAATDQVGRFRFNRGAHALYRTTPGRPVLERLGVEVVAVHPAPTKGGLGRLGDRLGLLPTSAGALARTDLFDDADRLRGGEILQRIVQAEPADLAGMTIAEWFDDLGADGTWRHVCEMLCRLTGYLADFELVSADVAAAQLQASFGGVDYLDDGWSSLVDGLLGVAHRRGVQVRGNVKVHAVTPDGGRVRIDLGDHELLGARRVVLAAGTPQANAALLPDVPASWAGLTPPARAACLDVGLATRPTVRFLQGLDRPLYLSCHAPDGSMAPDGGSVYHALRYLRADEDPSLEETRAELVDHCRVAGIDPDDVEESRYLHRMVVCGGLPTPAIGGMAGRPPVITGLDGVLVAGDWVGPAGHLADASLVSGELAGRAVAEGLDRGTTAGAPA